MWRLRESSSRKLGLVVDGFAPTTDNPRPSRGQVAQLVEHLTENQGVAGSSPALPTTPTAWGHGQAAKAAEGTPRSKPFFQGAPMASAQPQTITRSDPARISIEWADGHTTTYTAQQLRRLCPCARCIDEVTGNALLNPETVPAELNQADLRLVGNYAISVRFSDGHDTGIYPFPMLREHDPNGPDDSGR